MSDRETIDTAFEDMIETELETVAEVAETAPISNVIPLTADLVMQVLAKLRAGEAPRLIKNTVILEGPRGQKLTLTFGQIKEIADRRRHYYNRLKNAGLIDE